ncbi:MAG: hypothetical protein ACOCQA_01165 [bacterium]
MIKKHFLCKSSDREWSGDITNLINYGSHYEMRIESLSGISVVFGETSMGNFICIPDFNAGCHLAEFNNEFYSKEKLLNVINQVDAITIAKALETISNQLEKGASKNHGLQR